MVIWKSVIFNSFLLCALNSSLAHAGLFDMFGDDEVAKAPAPLEMIDTRFPIYENQDRAMGLSEDTFKINDKLKTPVDFWLKIYTEYGKSQGVIHDVNNLKVVYAVVDFQDINDRKDLKESEKERLRQKLVEQTKQEVLESQQKIIAQGPSVSTSTENGAGTSEGLDTGDAGGVDLALNDLDRKIIALWEPFGGIEALKNNSGPQNLRFQLGQKDQIQAALIRSGAYLPMMEEIFRREGLPIQLTRIVFVESSFNVFARSKVGASGLWQIMPSAARGRLRMNRTVDLRNHPLHATRLAARIFKFNYEMLEDWSLAITGYNHGPYGVQKLVKRAQSKDLGELIQSGEGPRFGFASRNFYVSFLAAMIVEAQAEKFFPGLKRDTPMETEPLKAGRPLYFSDVVSLFKGDREWAIRVNPHLQRLAYNDAMTLDESSEISIPVSLRETADSVLAQIPTREMSMKIKRELAQEKPRKIKKWAFEGKRKKRYRVARGDTLYRISRNLGVSLNAILHLNDLKGPGAIRAGQLLKIP